MADEFEKQSFFLENDEDEIDEHPKKIMSDDEWAEDAGDDEDDDADLDADADSEEE